MIRYIRRSRLPLTFFLFSSIATIIPGCKKNTVPIPEPRPAVVQDASFNILDCPSGYVENGFYLTENVLVDTISYIEVIVDVTKAGNWKLSTDTVNGLFYAGSGIITIGEHTVKLFAQGIPLEAGPTTLSLGEGRSFFVEVHEAGEPSGCDSTYYFKVKVDGRWYNTCDNFDERLRILLETNHYGPTTFGFASYMHYGFIDPYNLHCLMIAMHADFGSDIYGPPTIHKRFAPGIYPFASVARGAGGNVLWKNETSKMWETSPYVNNRSSSMRILAVENATYDHTNGIKVKVRFNCTLRRYDGTEVTIESGEAVTFFPYSL